MRSKNALDKLLKEDLVAEVRRLEKEAEAAAPSAAWPVSRYAVGRDAELVAAGDGWALVSAGDSVFLPTGRLLRLPAGADLAEYAMTWDQAAALARSLG